MGYSDVRMVIRAPKKFLLSQIAVLRLSGDDRIKEALDEMRVIQADNENSAVLYLVGDDWKWYDSYPDVAAFIKIWDHFEEFCWNPEIEIDLAFARIGEDTDDVELRYRGDEAYDLLEINRCISSNYIDGKAVDLRPRLISAA